ncbi:MAG: zf-HC2 domain-containing protein [Gemmatimonadota bacterium]
MECKEFLTHFSRFYDAQLEPSEQERFQVHLEACSQCARYHRVVRGGVELLRREIRPLAPPADFRPRLDHRIFHVADQEALLHGASASGVTAATAAALAVLLVLAAWSPLLQGREPEVDLPTIVVEARGAPPVAAQASAYSRSQWMDLPPSLRNPSLWRETRPSLYHFSPLSNPYGGSGVIRTGLE